MYNRIIDKPTEYFSTIEEKDNIQINDSQVLNEPTISDKQLVHNKITNKTDCWKYQLCQIPTISNKTADTIIQLYPSSITFYNSMLKLTSEEQKEELSKIKITDGNGKSRKISKKTVELIVDYLLTN
jgi:hypothetical protein